MGVPFARTAGVAPTWALVVALIASAAAVTAEPPEDALVSTVQDALQTHARGDVDAALGKYDAIVDDAPAFARLSGTAAATVLNNAGGILYTRGDANAALAYFERAVRVHPAHAESLVNLAVCQSEDFGNHAEALVAAREAVRLRPDHAKSHHVLGNVLQRLGQMPEAHLRFKTAEALAEGTRAKPEPGSYRRREARRVGELQKSGVFADDDANDADDKKGRLNERRELVLETLSVVPPVFRIPGFLSKRERARIVALARPEMERSRTVSDGEEEKKKKVSRNRRRAAPPRRGSRRTPTTRRGASGTEPRTCSGSRGRP
jgi:tetratricopeptide (TPR) repeat protein